MIKSKRLHVFFGTLKQGKIRNTVAIYICNVKCVIFTIYIETSITYYVYKLTSYSLAKLRENFTLMTILSVEHKLD